jgi:uncharacterized protein
MQLPPELAGRYDRLQQLVRGLESALVAFSGGVDSALMLKVAVLTLGAERVLAVTARSPSVPTVELAEAARLAREIGAAHELLDTHELENPRYRANPPDRCYLCKDELYTRLAGLAQQRGLATVVNGVNADDLGDYRPGLRAAGEHGVRTPLAEAGLTKADVRQLAAALGLSVHDKPASPCLSSRVPYGEEITPEKLRRIEEAERFLRELGLRECRVRHHEKLARIEVPADQIARFADPELRSRVEHRLRELGFHYVTLDLRGLRSGSLNEPLLGSGLRAGLSR